MVMKIKCLAVDDEPLALELIKSYIIQTPFLELIGCYGSAIDALTAMKNNEANLLFLDIQMPNLSGLQLASIIDTYKTKVIFTTAFDQYALEGFKADAIDYLLKPISYSDFLKSAQKAQRYISGTSPSESFETGSIMVKADYKLHKIDFSDIIYLEAVRDYVAIYTESAGKIMTLSALKNIEANLPPQIFARVHRSFIVNISKVKTIERNRIVFGKCFIPISDAYKKYFMELLNKKAF